MELLNIAVSLSTLIILEIVLGIDNLVFLSILIHKLPVEQREKARQWGLALSWITRILLLFCAAWLVKLVHPIVQFANISISLRDIFLFLGGAFLIAKATQEIHQEVEVKPTNLPQKKTKYSSFKKIIVQIALMDIIFSLDSVLTAIGLTSNFIIMAIAITAAIIVMLFLSAPVSKFIINHPSLKMLALAFLILIGMILIADSFSFHIPRGYIYFSMAFSLSVEILNLIKKSSPNK